jgi:UDP-3-O-[3-hydroxymyristoyl] glucosamine N-acyltransferase
MFDGAAGFGQYLCLGSGVEVEGQTIVGKSVTGHLEIQ